MLFLLVPITSGKITSENVIKLITSPIGLGSILAGFTVSYIGGKGVGVLPMNPTILLGVLIGTLIAVLFTKVTSRINYCGWNHSYYFYEMKGIF